MRRSLDLTQTEFASRIGTTANVLTNYETGRRNPSSSVINNICKTFNVNEDWLRTGSGEMFLELSHDDEIAAFVNGLMQQESESFRRRLIAALSRLDDAGWDALERLIEDTAREHDQAAADEPDQHAIWEAEARAEAEQLYHQILAEKREAAGYSASPPTDYGDLLA